MRARVCPLILLGLLVAVASFAATPSGDDEKAIFAVTLGSNLSLHPGDVYQESLFQWVCCVYPVATPLPARFLVDPPDAGVSIDAQSGVVTVARDAYPGARVRVYAIVLNGKRVVSHEIAVYDERSHPLVGHWRQTADLMCFAGTTVKLQSPPREPISDLNFRADGVYTMVRVPIEISVDISGPYTFNVTDRSLIVGVGNGARLPLNFRAQGTYELKPGTPQQLVLDGVWFGKETQLGTGCGAVFERVR